MAVEWESGGQRMQRRHSKQIWGRLRMSWLLVLTGNCANLSTVVSSLKCLVLPAQHVAQMGTGLGTFIHSLSEYLSE